MGVGLVGAVLCSGKALYLPRVSSAVLDLGWTVSSPGLVYGRHSLIGRHETRPSWPPGLCGSSPSPWLAMAQERARSPGEA